MGVEDQGPKVATIEVFGERQQRLLRLLLQHRDGLTIEELSTQLNVTRTAVKQHLQALEADSYVGRGALRRGGGRPGRIFLITSRGIDLFPKQYSWFSSIMLQRMRKESGGEGINEAMHAMAAGVAAAAADRLKGLNAPQLIEETAALMSELGYEASVTKPAGRSSLPIIEACNCVYHALATDHPEVCEFDRELLRRLTGLSVEQNECMVRGGKCCRFIFGP